MAEKKRGRPRLFNIVDKAVEGDFSTANFGEQYRADRDEQGRIIGYRNGKQVVVRDRGADTDLKLVGTIAATVSTDKQKVTIKIGEEKKVEDMNSEFESFLEEMEDKGVERDSSPKDMDTIPNPPGRVVRVSRRAETHNWSEIRKHFVLGKRTQLEDGSWISEDYTLKELSQKFGVKYGYLRYKSSTEKWGNIRKAYLARVNQINIGQELGIYTQENYQAEISAMNAANKLGIVLDKYIEYKFGDILDSHEDVESDGSELSEELAEQMNAVNRNTGTPIFITEVKEAIKVANDIYALQRKIYDNAPKTEIEVIEKITNKPKFKNEKERQQLIHKLQAKLGGVLKPNEIVETVSQDTIVE